MRNRHLMLAGAAMALGLTACGPAEPELVPAPAANEVAGRGEGAVAYDEGVRVAVRADAWDARPEQLSQELTPLLVTITNRGEVPLRVRYNMFQLTARDGERFEVMPPYSINQTVTQAQTVTRPAYPTSNFYVAPYLSNYYPGYGVYSGPFGYDPVYYDPYVTVWNQIRLPTDDMVQRALPEGVVMPGGEVQGFLYFEDVGDGTERVQFTADLRSATAGNLFGEVTIPFQVTE